MLKNIKMNYRHHPILYALSWVINTKTFSIDGSTWHEHTYWQTIEISKIPSIALHIFKFKQTNNSI